MSPVPWKTPPPVVMKEVGSSLDRTSAVLSDPPTPAMLKEVGGSSDRISTLPQIPIPVSWDTEEDADNPRNWSSAKKNWLLMIVVLYTFVVYCGASIVTPASNAVAAKYNASIDAANLSLSMYVLGYGIGPLLFSPVSEIPSVGRKGPYIYSFAVYILISIGVAVIDNFPGLIILRFCQGFFGSPVLASGAASIQDIYDIYEAPYGYMWWTAALYSGPAVGPLLAAYAIPDNYRWPYWTILIMAGIVLVVLSFMPETSPSFIILQKARRLRATTRNTSYRAPSELKPLDFGSTLRKALIKPWEISIKDPAVGFAAFYTALVYSIYYSYFEVFPLVYVGIYGFTAGGLSLIFLAIIVGCIIGLSMYYMYSRYYFIPRARKHHAVHRRPVQHEEWLRPGLVGIFGPPLGLFLFAWTARADVHWSVPTIGIVIFATFLFLTVQAIFCYIPLTYPTYVASLLAANDFTRSACAAVVIQVSRPMYVNLGVDRGVSLLAGLSVIGIVGMYFWYFFGASMRAKSTFVG